MDITNKITEIFSGENSLISTTIEEIKLEKDEFDELQIQITIGNFSKKSKYSKICLLFNGIVEFKFYYNSDHFFYNIENYKLLYFEDTIYLSFDPDDSAKLKSENDSDFILAKSVRIL
ncbi:hypothetical protein [Elizabethkingia meningoseptica]|uniref:hypothetical protein n=1 Tax=Elizabethkingia meningoseptica TaxID=238 RepID=UPI0023B09762|nr:hypothetical protein [Elizabethkingia meningoseptica]MDE5505751.1 hypothetical protein [Elizabethkingia meningoseptica]HAY3550922.1 hypothetical protein [Elizabethkingia meningoseptica]